MIQPTTREREREREQAILLLTDRGVECASCHNIVPKGLALCPLCGENDLAA